jgi:dihydropteroate synthase
VKRTQIVVDPGVGFAKLSKSNWDLLGNIRPLAGLGFPTMIGISRKQFLANFLPTESSVLDRDLPIAISSALLAERRDNAIRVHDVVSTKLALDIVAHIG